MGHHHHTIHFISTGHGPNIRFSCPHESTNRVSSTRDVERSLSCYGVAYRRGVLSHRIQRRRHISDRTTRSRTCTPPIPTCILACASSDGTVSVETPEKRHLWWYARKRSRGAAGRTGTFIPHHSRCYQSNMSLSTSSANLTTPPAPPPTNRSRTIEPTIDHTSTHTRTTRPDNSVIVALSRPS